MHYSANLSKNGIQGIKGSQGTTDHIRQRLSVLSSQVFGSISYHSFPTKEWPPTQVPNSQRVQKQSHLQNKG